MKKIRVYIAMAAVALAAVGCQQDPKVDFGLGAENITIGAVGGVEKVKISADDNWIASTDNTWITISPANGRGSAECKISIDSALLSTPRNGEVIIENMATHEIKKIAVSQKVFSDFLVPCVPRYSQFSCGFRRASEGVPPSDTAPLRVL